MTHVEETLRRARTRAPPLRPLRLKLPSRSRPSPAHKEAACWTDLRHILLSRRLVILCSGSIPEIRGSSGDEVDHPSGGCKLVIALQHLRQTSHAVHDVSLMDIASFNQAPRRTTCLTPTAHPRFVEAAKISQTTLLIATSSSTHRSTWDSRAKLSMMSRRWRSVRTLGAEHAGERRDRR